jgi:hypothetical protein
MLIADAITGCRHRLRDVGSARWSDAELTGHINHAMSDVSNYDPLPAFSSETAAQAIDISGISDLIRVTAVECPSGQYPRKYRRWQYEGAGKILVKMDSPSGNANIYYDKERAIGDALPDHEGIVIDLASGYALQDYAADTINKANIGESERFRLMGQGWIDNAFARLSGIQYERQLELPVIVLVDHTDMALQDYSMYVPLEVIDSTKDAAQEIDVSSISGLIQVTGVGFPSGAFPPRMRSWSPITRTDIMLMFAAPGGSWSGKIDLHYTKKRTSAQIIPGHEQIVDSLARAYALTEFSMTTTDHAHPDVVKLAHAEATELKQWAMGQLLHIKEEREESQ